MIVDDKVFDFIYTIAMRDATLQQAFDLTKSGLTKKSDLLNCTAAKKYVRKYIDDIIAGKNTSFDTVEKDVETAFGQFIPGKNFTFGNCQKLINMTVKYFYIVTYSDSTIRSHFNSYHCPMDNVMIEVAINELDNIGKTLNDINEFYNLKIIKANKTYLRQSWSQIDISDIKQYKLFQAAVCYLAQQQGVSPIEYDYLMWK